MLLFNEFFNVHLRCKISNVNKIKAKTTAINNIEKSKKSCPVVKIVFWSNFDPKTPLPIHCWAIRWNFPSSKVALAAFLNIGVKGEFLVNIRAVYSDFLFPNILRFPVIASGSVLNKDRSMLRCVKMAVCWPYNLLQNNLCAPWHYQECDFWLSTERIWSHLQKLSLHCSRNVPGSFEDCSRIFPGLFQDHSRIIPGSFQKQIF